MEAGKKIFFIGIGGVGMSALAVILRERGFDVSGSDRYESDMTVRLRDKGIDVRIGHDASNISDDIDTVVYTNAVSQDNPELQRAMELGKKVMERAAMLQYVGSNKYSIGISGTHGKTTTTSMVSRIFLHAGLEPSLAVGGVLPEIQGSGYEGNGKYCIYEACEAFASMMHLHPDVAVITNIDGDHLDYYGSMENIRKMFVRYLQENIPPHGIVIYNLDDRNLRNVVKIAEPRNTISIGIRHKEADFTAENIELDSYSSTFTVKLHGKVIGEYFINVPGMHNVYNSMLAIVTAHINGLPVDKVRESLATFRNANRRFQVKHTDEHLTVIDDYAHHPSEIRATLSAARKLSDKQNAQLIAVFQPHLYSRTEHFYKDFAKSLAEADRVVLTEIYAAREENVHNISTKIIYDEIIKIMGEENVLYLKDLDEAAGALRPYLDADSIVITLGAGDVWKVSEMFGHSCV